MARSATRNRVEILLRLIDEAYEKQTWHGPNLRGSLRGISKAEASKRPAAGRHNIWEIAVHAAYWKYIVRRRLTGDKSLSFPRKPSDWPRYPDDPSPKDLKADLALLGTEHRRLRDVVSQFPSRRLDARAPESQWTYAEHIHGIAAHDLYHAGQIQLVKRLRRGA